MGGWKITAGEREVQKEGLSNASFLSLSSLIFHIFIADRVQDS